MGWRDLIAIHGDPDFMVSYNGTGFDYAYLSGRMNLVCRQRNRFSSRFNFMGRILKTPNPLKVRELTSAAKGQNIISWFPAREDPDGSVHVRQGFPETFQLQTR